MKTKFPFAWLIGLTACLLLVGEVFVVEWGQAGQAAQVAQRDKKPSDALNQVVNQQRKQMTEVLRNAEQEKAQAPDQLEAIKTALRQMAVQRVAPFKAADWKGEELLALIRLYEMGEQYAPAVEAYRLYLKDLRNLNTLAKARIGLLRALLETDQLAEALKTLSETKLDFPGSFNEEMPLRLSLQKDLAVALRERGQVELSLQFAREAYDFTKSPQAMNPRWREVVDPLRPNLAALIVALLEQAGKQKEAGEFHQQVLKTDFDPQSQWRDAYQAELTSARLIGKPVPEVLVPRWLDGQPVKLNELRGKVVLVDFWALWCAPCVAAFPHFREWQTKYAGRGFEIVGVTRFYGRSDEKDDLNREQEWQALLAFKRKHQLSYSCAVGKMDDVTNDERYGVTGLPTTILIDRRGNVREVQRGGGNYRKLAQRIAKLIEEK
ncbi:MAG: TlpA family protein disulfide reductase [Acidobacteria bacterium]|nr:TlpA family protein disulfide reductase [Acidobacteriota bacterium]